MPRITVKMLLWSLTLKMDIEDSARNGRNEVFIAQLQQLALQALSRMTSILVMGGRNLSIPAYNSFLHLFGTQGLLRHNLSRGWYQAQEVFLICETPAKRQLLNKGNARQRASNPPYRSHAALKERRMYLGVSDYLLYFGVWCLSLASMRLPSWRILTANNFSKQTATDEDLVLFLRRCCSVSVPDTRLRKRWCDIYPSSEDARHDRDS
jgi:hypothetical protein